MTATDRVGLRLYVAGVVLVLVGNVFPWLAQRGEPVWAWDVSVLWPVLGRGSLIQIPPSVGAVTLLAAIGASVPIFVRRRVSAPLSAGLAALVTAVAALTLLRGIGSAGAAPQPGLYLALAGGVLLAAGSIALGD